jgi:hypothetical protein
MVFSTNKTEQPWYYWNIVESDVKHHNPNILSQEQIIYLIGLATKKQVFVEDTFPWMGIKLTTVVSIVCDCINRYHVNDSTRGSEKLLHLAKKTIIIDRYTKQYC